MEKTDLLFRMMDDPGQYTDEQWREILADSECASLYEMMCKTRSALDAEQIDQEFTSDTVDQEWERFAAAHQARNVKPFDWRKIAAAIVVLAVFLSSWQSSASLPQPFIPISPILPKPKPLKAPFPT